MTYLLDGDVLIALCVTDHVHHERASGWIATSRSSGNTFATCPVTEDTLLRLHFIYAEDSNATVAWRALESIREMKGHREWLDNFSYVDVPHQHLRGHRQLTDAWLVELARRKKGKLATLDASLATLYPEHVELIPVIL